jgi:hypothetical protein
MKDRGGYVLHLDGTLTAPVKQIVRICSLALNDPDSGTIHTIEARVQTFYHQLVNNDELQEVGYRKMQQQIEKYWEKLFADPVIVTRGEETLTLAPQRTNNILLPAGFHYPQDPAKPFPGRTDGGFGA